MRVDGLQTIAEANGMVRQPVAVAAGAAQLQVKRKEMVHDRSSECKIANVK